LKRHIEEQNKKMEKDTETLLKFPAEQNERLQAFEQRRESLSQIGAKRTATTRPRRQAIAADKWLLNQEQPEILKLLLQPLIEEQHGYRILNEDTEILPEGTTHIVTLDYPENDIFFL
jgi:hypothetical protein